MTTIFILQLICCTITSILAIQLLITGLQVRWKVGHYETARWMLGLFVVSMAYFIFISRREIALRKQRLLEDSGIDLLPYVRYAKASISLLYLTAALLPITILFNTLLIIIGPLMILNIVFFVQSFISLGYYITPSEEILGGQAQ